MNDIWSGAFIRTVAFAAATVALAVWEIVKRVREKRAGIERSDERQRAARGRAYRTAFFTSAALSVAVSLASANGLSAVLDAPTLIMIPLFGGLAALAAHLIASDALFSGDVPIWSIVAVGASLTANVLSTVSDIRSVFIMPYHMQKRALIALWIGSCAAEAAIFALLVYKFVRGRREGERSEQNWRDGE